MVNYKNSKIYRLVCNTTGNQYIGCTTSSLSIRLCQHKKSYYDGKNNLTSLILINDNFSIILIEDYPCERKEQLLQRQRYYIETMDCVNEVSPLKTHRDWYDENKEDYIARQKIWNSNNKEKLREYQKTFKNKSKGVIIDGNHEIELHIEDIYDEKPESFNEDDFKENMIELIEENINRKLI